ncbi:thioredoxin family protein [Sporosarcina sp. OR05]|uniref:thioredoxin family protein n=1 Tax=Sporosarcina sp. OR05 TaxID=2969819 RepID=UPI00352AD7DF
MTVFTNVTPENFEKEVLQCDLPVVLLFSIDDCEPWTVMEPVCLKLAEEYKGKIAFKNYHVEIEDVFSGTNELLKKYDVIGFPTTMLFVPGKPPIASLGNMDRELFVAFISKIEC